MTITNENLIQKEITQLHFDELDPQMLFSFPCFSFVLLLLLHRLIASISS
jgi:hypothetical protein